MYSKCGVENFEEHWAKAEPKNSSHLLYKADNTLTNILHWYFRQKNL